MDPIIANLIGNVLVPEVIELVKNYHARNNGKWPTEAEILAELPRLADMYADAGEAFLHRHDPPPVMDSVKKPSRKRRKKQ